MAWPSHQAHGRVHGWLQRYAHQGWATCPFTEAAFVRVISNPAFSPDALSVAQAIDLLASNLQHSAHYFWPDEIGFLAAIAPLQDRLIGHQQVSDAYLLGLVLRRKGKLATLDAGIVGLLPEGSPHRSQVVRI